MHNRKSSLLSFIVFSIFSLGAYADNKPSYTAEDLMISCYYDGYYFTNHAKENERPLDPENYIQGMLDKQNQHKSAHSHNEMEKAKLQISAWEKSGKENPLEEQQIKIYSYALGWTAENTSEIRGIKLNIQSIADGMNDALMGNELKYTTQAINHANKKFKALRPEF